MVTHWITERRIEQFVERNQVLRNDRADLTALRLGSGKAIGKLFVLS